MSQLGVFLIVNNRRAGLFEIKSEEEEVQGAFILVEVQPLLF